MTNHGRKPGARRNRGVALITALLLLSLFTVLTLSMVIATTSDTLIDGYYRNARGSFYGADSGVNAVRQYMTNQLNSFVPSPFTTFSVPVTGANEQSILTALGSASTGFGSYRSTLGTQTSSWPEQFQVVYSAACATTGGVGCPTYMTLPATCTVNYTIGTGTIPTCYAAGNGSATWYQLSYPYQITVIGQSSASETNTIQEQGTIFLTVTISSSTNSSSSFAAWGMFIDQSPICNGSTLVGGQITGPVFTNGAWNYGNTSYIYTDAVGSASPNIGYQFGNCYQSPNLSYTNGGQTISPTFQSGIHLNQHTIPLPANSFDQKQAVLDGIGTADGTLPTQAQMSAALKNVSATVWPASGGTPSTGVYLPYFNNAGTMTFGTAPVPSTAPPGCGGIYVIGDAMVAVTAGTVTLSSSPQIYTIKQGSTTTTVTIDTLANGGNGQTKITDGVTTQTIYGNPQQCTSPGVVTRDATMLYVDGNITALQGGGQGVGTIQNTTALDIVANGDVTITGDLLYKNEPVTLTQTGSIPADTLIPANNYGQTLGIYTGNGDINLNLNYSSQPNGNLQIDASIAAISSGGSGGLVNIGRSINTLAIVGGRIQNTIQNINAATRNVWFDRRYAQGGFAPPWFPSTTVTASTTYTSPVPTVTANRTSWVNITAQ